MSVIYGNPIITSGGGKTQHRLWSNPSHRHHQALGTIGNKAKQYFVADWC